MKNELVFCYRGVNKLIFLMNMIRAVHIGPTCSKTANTRTFSTDPTLIVLVIQRKIAYLLQPAVDSPLYSVWCAEAHAGVH